MTTNQTDRIGGPISSLAIKAPCRAATTAAITLSGLQTVDGVSLAVGDRVLVKDQADQTTNGVYVASASAWQRDTDFDGNRDIINGSAVLVGTEGAANAHTLWLVSTIGQITIGTSSITFAQAPLKGDTGATGATGPTGATGAAGTGVPSGGNTNQVLAKNSSATGDTSWKDIVLRNYLAGLTLSTAGSSVTMSIGAGEATDSTNVARLILAAAIAKTTSAWAVGNAQGGLDTGAIANSTGYHFFLIIRPDTGVVDVLFSLSATSPTMPTNYTLFRRIGWGKTDGSGHWTAFSQDGDEFLWATPVSDVNASNLGTTATLNTLTVPTGIKVTALLRAGTSNASAGNAVLITSPDETDRAPNGITGDYTLVNSVSNVLNSGGHIAIRTNTSGQIRLRSGNASTTIQVASYGWLDQRGKDA